MAMNAGLSGASNPWVDRDGIRLFLQIVGLLGGAMMLGSSLYQAAVDVPNWTAALPRKAEDFRACLRHSTPTRFYQIVNAATVLGLVGAMVAGGFRRTAQLWLSLGAVGAFVLTAVVTIVFVVPLNDILFFHPVALHTAEAIRTAAGQWQVLHQLRMGLLGLGVLAATRATILVARDQRFRSSVGAR
jgi:hypothetical protein